MKKTTLIAAALACVAASASAESCVTGKTLVEGKLTIATGNPAYSPWVMNDAPESGEGYEAAAAYAIAEELGFAKEDVVWVRTTFDEAIQPGAKNFDFNLQQISILPERDEIVDFSVPYYTTTRAVVVRGDSKAADVELTLEGLRGLVFGGVAGQTSTQFIEKVIRPEASMLLYDDLADVTSAMTAGQIDATIFDLPTALFTTAVLYPEGKVIAQVQEGSDADVNPDAFGLLMAEGSVLKPCLDEAISALHEDGTLAQIEEAWLAGGAGMPFIEAAE